MQRAERGCGQHDRQQAEWLSSGMPSAKHTFGNVKPSPWLEAIRVVSLTEQPDQTARDDVSMHPLIGRNISAKSWQDGAVGEAAAGENTTAIESKGCRGSWVFVTLGFGGGSQRNRPFV